MSKHRNEVFRPSVSLSTQARYAMAMGVAVILIVLLALEFRQTQRQARIDIENINTALEARLDDGLLTPLEHKLAAIAAGVGGTKLASVSASEIDRLNNWLSLFADVEGIVITDDAGNVLLGSTDQSVDYPSLFASGKFTAGSATTDTRLAVDAPHSLLLAVPIKDQFGKAVGWVVGATSLDSIRMLLAEVSLGQRGVVTLRLASQPASVIRIPEVSDPRAPLVADEIDEAIRKHIAKGTITKHSRVDDVKRLYGFTQIGSFDLVLLTGIAVSDFLRSWYWTLITSLSITAGLLFWIFRSDGRLIKARQMESFATAALQESVDNTELLLHSVGQAIVGVDIHGRCTFCNPAGLKLFGVKTDQLVGHSINPHFCLSINDYCDLTNEILSAIRNGKTFQIVCDNFQDAFGNNRTVEVFAYPSYSTGIVVGAVLVLNDISERRENERALAHLAYHDTLTELSNRNGFEEHLKAQLRDKGKLRQAFSIAYIDVDGFRHINESLGQAFGDAVLKEVAKRLKSHNQLSAVARLSGDLFAGVIIGSSNAYNVTLALQTAMKRPWNNGLEMPVSVSIGLAKFPDDGFTFESLRTAADVALNYAKRLGHSSIRVYDKRLGDASARRFDLQNMLSSANVRGELSIEYQPKIDILQGRVYGAEALLRWVSPTLGKISPSEFIPIAETNGLIIPITEWVINEVCAQMATWERHGLEPIHVSVNFAPMHFKRGNLYETVRCALERHTIQPHLLELELTESAVVEDTETVVATLNRLRQLGIGLSVDDFGTGYSNLAYLKRFNLTALKVDRSFVSKLPEDGESASIVRAIISLAKELNLDVIAEGVESEKTLSFLDALGCSKIQGYYYSPSLTPVCFEEYVMDFNRKP